MVQQLEATYFKKEKKTKNSTAKDMCIIYPYSKKLNNGQCIVMHEWFGKTDP